MPTAKKPKRKAAKRVAKPAPKPVAKPTPADLSSVGRAPDDELQAIAWMQKLLVQSAQMVIDDPDLEGAAKRRELRDIANSVVRLQDSTKIAAVDAQLRANDQKIASVHRGPGVVIASNVDEGAGPIKARRGRPPRSALS